MFSSSEKHVWSESGVKYALIKHRLQTKTVLTKYVGGFFWCVRTTGDFFTGGSVIMDYRLLARSNSLRLNHLYKRFVSYKHAAYYVTIIHTTPVHRWCVYQTLILTAPIHCRASIAETLMHFSKSILMEIQTHPHLGWPKGEYNVAFLDELLL